jgi:hypothetical protein
VSIKQYLVEIVRLPDSSSDALLHVAAKLLSVAEPDLFLLEDSGWKSETDWRADVEKWETAYKQRTSDGGDEHG